MKSVDQWLNAYGESHQNPVNKSIHWICIPLILLSLIGILATLPMPFGGGGFFHWGSVAIVLSVVYYATLSRPLAVGMGAVGAAALLGVALLSQLPVPLWFSSVVIFTGAWVGQFIGHKIEGKKPSFFEDLQFLMIGPMWLLADAYRRAGLKY